MISIYQKRCFQPLERSFLPIGSIASDGWKLRLHPLRRTDEQLNSFYFSISKISKFILVIYIIMIIYITNLFKNIFSTR